MNCVLLQVGTYSALAKEELFSDILKTNIFFLNNNNSNNNSVSVREDHMPISQWLKQGCEAW